MCVWSDSSVRPAIAQAKQRQSRLQEASAATAEATAPAAEHGAARLPVYRMSKAQVQAELREQGVDDKGTLLMLRDRLRASRNAGPLSVLAAPSNPFVNTATVGAGKGSGSRSLDDGDAIIACAGEGDGTTLGAESGSSSGRREKLAPSPQPPLLSASAAEAGFGENTSRRQQQREQQQHE